jgi:hypothetical protein
MATNRFIQRIGLQDILHRHVPSDARCTVPNARALGVLLRPSSSREPIYRQQETVQAFASGMFGIAAEEMDHLGDDRLGRALDRLFDADRAALLTEVVVAVSQRFNLRFDEFHNDSTSISYVAAKFMLRLRGRARDTAGFPGPIHNIKRSGLRSTGPSEMVSVQSPSRPTMRGDPTACQLRPNWNATKAFVLLGLLLALDGPSEPPG